MRLRPLDTTLLFLLWATVNTFSQTVDSFNPSATAGAYVSTVCALAVQPDGKILVGGMDFTTLGGQPRSRIGRLNPDGTLDAAFNPGASYYVFCLAVQLDGKILVGGDFTTLGGQGRSKIGRLNPDGTLDAAFNPGANAYVYCLAVQPDGKILAGGNFTTLGGQARGRVGRLNPDGTLDGAFNPGASNAVYCLAVQADGKILVGGRFTTLSGQARGYIGRLNPDGTLDAAFNPGADNDVCCLAVQADGKILVGGTFTTLGGQGRSKIGRLNPDGTLDVAFNPGADNYVNTLATQADGKILVGGKFFSLGGQSRGLIGRLNADGTLDTGFQLSGTTEGNAASLALQPDGKILLCGIFRTVNGQSRASVARLNNTEPATEKLTYSDSKVTWQRAATAPELGRAFFDVSTNATTWTPVGEGIRIPGGWRLNGLSLPPNGFIRSWGIVSGGLYNGSSYFVQSVIAPASITLHPQSQTNFAGADITFSVQAAGSPPLSYQWCFNGAALAAATNSLLMLTNAQLSNAGSYTVIVTNAINSVTSQVAALTLIAVAIETQPRNITNLLGGLAQFTVQASGTPPLRYQWFRNGTILPGATHSNVLINPIQLSDFASYAATVSNAYGSATSSIASLTQAFAPSLLAQPTNLVVLEGSPASLSVQASGTLPVYYQWQRSGTNLAPTARLTGITTSSLLLTNADLSLEGDYRVIVTNPFGAITSAVARVTVLAAPQITLQPAGLTTNVGSTITLRVGATGTAPLHYQWCRNGNPLRDLNRLSGAGTTALQVQNLSFDDIGYYTVVITNSVGSVTSSVARLLVSASNLLYQTGFEVADGFTVSASLTNQGGWKGEGKGSHGIKSQVMPNCGQQAFVGGGTPDETYWLHTWYPLNTGSLPTNAVVEFSTLLRIEDSSNRAYDTFRWIVKADSSSSYCFVDFNNLDYSIWLFNGSWTKAALSFVNGQTYQLKVRIDFGQGKWSAWLDGQVLAFNVSTTQKFTGLSGISAGWLANDRTHPGDNFMAFDDYRVVLVQSPVIQQQPQSLTLLPGNSAQLSVEAIGYGPLSYRWWQEGVGLVSGATNALLELKNVTPAATGNYFVVVSNSFGAVTSAVAQVRVVSAGVLYETHFEPQEGFVAGRPLGGQSGWLSYGGSSSGIITGLFGEGNQQAFVGFNGAEDQCQVWYPLNLSSVPTNQVLLFSTLLQLTDSTNGIYNEFQWSFGGPGGTGFAVDFQNSDWSVYYLANGWHEAPITFENGVTYQLTVLMDFGRNSWSAWLSGKPLLSQAPLSSGSTSRSSPGLSYLSANWFTYAGWGDNRMYFDNCRLEVLQAPILLALPQSATTEAGLPVFFTVVAAGVHPMTYQWQKDGTNLTDVGRIVGAQSACLTINGASTLDAGSYSVRVSNAYGATNSPTATLQVFPITRPAINQVRLANGKLSFTLPGQAGVLYVIEYKTSLQPAEPWKVLQKVNGAGSPMAIADNLVSTNAARYYRLRLE